MYEILQMISMNVLLNFNTINCKIYFSRNFSLINSRVKKFKRELGFKYALYVSRYVHTYL